VRNQPHKPNSSDIARLAGVSRSTVSRVINGYANVPEATRKRVTDVIERHGYYPSISGQTLRGKHAHCVGVFLGERGWQDETQARLLYNFIQTAQSLGYMTLSGQMGNFDTPACDRVVREVLCSGCVDAGVFLNATGGELLIRKLLWEGQTIGAVGTTPDQEHERLFTVGLDRGIANDTVSYVLSMGHRRAVVLGDMTSYPDGSQLLELFLKTAAETGLYAYRPPMSDHGSFTQQAGAVVAQPDPPKLLICTDLDSVYAAYRAVNDHGLTVGKDISILGMGLIPSNLPLWPSLASFRFDPREMITSLSNRLIRFMEGAQNEPRHEQIRHQWTQGDSFARFTA